MVVLMLPFAIPLCPLYNIATHFLFLSFFARLDDDINGDLSGDEHSMASDNGVDLHHDGDSMDSDRGGALNLVNIKFVLLDGP